MNSIDQGKCINLNYCTLAQNGVIQEVASETEFKCQECERALSPINSKENFRLIKPVLLVASVLTVFGCLAFYMTSENWFPSFTDKQEENIDPVVNHLIIQEEDYSHDELRNILLHIGNENIDFDDRIKAADESINLHFSPQARVKEIGLNGTVVKIHMAKDYLIYLSSVITLKDIEVLESKISKQDSKYREVSLREIH